MCLSLLALNFKLKRKDIIRGVIGIRTDYERVDNKNFVNFCNIHDICHKFSARKTYHQDVLLEERIKLYRK